MQERYLHSTGNSATTPGYAARRYGGALAGRVVSADADAFLEEQNERGKLPVAWRIEIPEQQLDLNVSAILDDQELTLGPLTYWEGAVDVNGDGIIGRG